MKIIPSANKYMAADDGSIWRDGRLLRTTRHTNGYRKIKISVGGVSRDAYVHRLVCEAHHGACPDGHECRHIDGSRDNNHPSNLCWGTRDENEADKERHGTRLRGSDLNNALLTEDIVSKARRDARLGKRILDISAEIGVPQRCLAKAITGKTWKHVAGALRPHDARRALSDNDVLDIRDLAATKGPKELAARYGVSRAAIHQIVKFKTYANVIRCTIGSPCTGPENDSSTQESQNTKETLETGLENAENTE